MVSAVSASGNGPCRSAESPRSSPVPTPDRPRHSARARAARRRRGAQLVHRQPRGPRPRPKLADEHQGRVVYIQADMSPAATAAASSPPPASPRPRRHPRQQRRHPARGPVPTSPPPNGTRSSPSTSPRPSTPPPPPSPDARPGLGPDRRHRLRPRPHRLPLQVRLCRRQARRRRLTKVVALETAEEPITCNAICPGYVLTPLVEAQIPDTMKQYGMDRETVIREVILPASPHTSSPPSSRSAAASPSSAAGRRAVTGTTLSVDGGWTAL